MSQRVGWSGLGIWVHHFVSNPPVLTFGRATREDYDVGSSRSQAVPLGDPCGEQGSLSAHFGVFSSKQQADVVCKAKLCGTCSTDFVRGSVKRQARHRMIKQRQKMCSRHCPKKKQYLCRLPLALVILQLFFCNWVTATKKYSAASLPLKRERSSVLEGLLQMATLFAVWSILCRIHTPLVW